MTAPTTTGITMSAPETVLASVSEYYGKVLSTTKDLKTSACTACGAPPAHVRAALKRVPEAVTEKFYGCGNPLPLSIQGLHVLDLGCGSGRDCYVAAQFAGATGSVTGIDMTDEQLDVAKANAAAFAAANPTASPMRYLRGYIEDIAGAGVAPDSMDLIISNCVVNLSPNKAAVLQGVYAALKNGGEFHFSDVYCDRRLPESVRRHEVLFGECISGALYIGDFLSLARSVGFRDVRQLSVSPITVGDQQMKSLLGAANFFSITYRLFKLPDLEDRCEDYGQVAYYKGGMGEAPVAYRLDDHHVFEIGRPVLVCGNTASMLENTWLKPYFRIVGTRDVHYGLFAACGGDAACQSTEGSCAAPTSSCC